MTYYAAIEKNPISGSQPGTIIVLQGHMAMSGDMFGRARHCCDLVGSGQAMLLNIRQCTGQPFHNKNIIQPKMSVALRLRNHDLDPFLLT